MRAALYCVVSFLIFSSLLGCGESAPSPQPVGGDVIQKYALVVEGQPETTSIRLPQQLAGTDWELKQNYCQQAGYDLAPYAGQNLIQSRYSLVEMYFPQMVMDIDLSGSVSIVDLPSLPLYLWVIAEGQTTVCSYVSVTEDSTYFLRLLRMGAIASRFFAVNDTNIK